MARIGQNLSTAFSIKIDKNTKIEMRPDDVSKVLSNNPLLYTDGIGMISADLIKRIQKETGKKSTVFQVRFQGSKGLLALNPELNKNTIVLRESMHKFNCPHLDAQMYLDIL